MDLNPTLNWTAIFLIKGVDDTVKNMDNLVQELLLLKKTDDLAVILCINIKVEKIPAGYERGQDPATSGQTALIYCLESKQGGGCQLKILQEKPDFNIQRQQDIADFFDSNVLPDYAAKRYVLFTWDHGQPFGLYPQKKPLVGPDKGLKNVPAIIANNNRLYQPLLVHFRLWEFYRALSKDEKDRSKLDIFLEDKLDMLVITELKNAIKDAFGDKNISLVVMANCYLQFFDTGYELSSCVNYLVAYETDMYFDNPFEYKTILEILTCNPDISDESLARMVVDSFSLSSNSSNDDQTVLKRLSVALFANDLSWYPAIAKFIDELADQLYKELPRFYDKIKAAVDMCKHFSPGTPQFCLLDFGNFIRCLYSLAPGLFSVKSYEILNILLQKTVIASFIGDQLQNEDSAPFAAPSCFSVYLPNTNGFGNTDFFTNFIQSTSVYATEFEKRFKWERFIVRFTDMLGNPPN